LTDSGIAPDSARRTVILHAINGVGTGHLSRQVALASYLLAAQPSLWPVLLSEGPATLDMAGTIPVLQLPSTAHLRDYFDHDEAAAETLLQAAVRMSFAALASLQPRLVVHDTMVWPPMLRAASLLGARQALCLRPRRDLRDYLSDPLCPIRQMDLVFVPDVATGNEATLDLLAEAGIPALWTGPIHRVVRDNPDGAPNGPQLKPGTRVIVITSGGGSGQDTIDHFDQCLAALRQVKPDGISVVAVLGPLFNGALRVEPGFPHDLTVIRATDQLPSLLAAASLILCRGGYGVVHESAAGGARVLATAAPRSTDDQGLRLRRLQADGRCELIPDGSTAHDLAIQIGKSLRAPRPGPASLTDSAAMTELGQRLRLLAQTKQDENSLPDLSDIHI